MPYVLEARREVLRPKSQRPAENAGEYHFQIASLMNDFICNRTLNYETINSAIGVLECAKLELYRRLAYYEEGKRDANGDVFTFE